jgi:ABC-type Co2+ transport system permease subunit
MEQGIVSGIKLTLSYATAAGILAITAKAYLSELKQNNFFLTIIKTVIATALVFSFFELMPHYPIGISEVHLILGSTLFLLFGIAPAAGGLAAGLLLQGLFFEPTDLPQYGMNITTLLVPLFAMSFVAKKIIPQNIAYKEIKYTQALKLSLMYQGGIVAWVGFWSLYGHGFTVENLTEILTFGIAYLSVILVEPLIDLAVLSGAKSLVFMQNSKIFDFRLFNTVK